jgi:hypothetical protein
MACAFQMGQLPSGDAPTEKPDWSSGAVQVDVNLYIRHRNSFFALDERALEALMRPEPDQRYLASGLQRSARTAIASLPCFAARRGSGFHIRKTKAQNKGRSEAAVSQSSK